MATPRNTNSSTPMMMPTTSPREGMDLPAPIVFGNSIKSKYISTSSDLLSSRENNYAKASPKMVIQRSKPLYQ